jgi:hypothetical protein
VLDAPTFTTDDDSAIQAMRDALAAEEAEQAANEAEQAAEAAEAAEPDPSVADDEFATTTTMLLDQHGPAWMSSAEAARPIPVDEDDREDTTVGEVPEGLLALSSHQDESTRAYTAPQELIELAKEAADAADIEAAINLHCTLRCVLSDRCYHSMHAHLTNI